MTQDEIKALTEAVTKGGETLSSYVKGLKASEPEIKLDGVKKFLEDNEEGKKYLQSYADTKVTTGIETFKKNNLQKMIDDEIKKRYPDKDPKDKALEDLKAEMEKMKSESLRKDLTNKALKTMTEKKLPGDLVNFIVGEDEDTTNKNLETLEKIFSSHDEDIRTEILKDHTYKPGGQGGAEPTEEATKAQINSIFGINQ